MLRILESQAPARQTATDTISTLSSRLSSATLLEDRRAAILGLRSFAKQYPASVASGALRDLIAGLHKDGDDPDTVKAELETILGLFEADESSPEASEDITLWLADEFTQRQDNVTALLDLLESTEFFLRLYALKILSHVSAARPQRAQEAVFGAPLGVSRVTSVLDDRREAVRDEALRLLVALTPTSAELQKVVAFENAFDRIFALMENEGGLTHGSEAVQDCLSLLANLLRLNVSNQSYFREVGGIARLARLLTTALTEENSPDALSEWLKPQREMNIWGLLAIVQLFLIKGSKGTAVNQSAFWKQGILLRVLQLAFHPAFGAGVRAKSLETCGDIIRGNPSLQEQFGDLSVPLIQRQPSFAHNGISGRSTSTLGEKLKTTTIAQTRESNVIEALLGLVLEPAPISLFDVRLAACNCVNAFFEGHKGIRSHVLHRAIEGHRSGNDVVPNMLTVLLEPPASRTISDPYQQWMASVILSHLIYDNPDAKSMALKVSEGDAESGEEVVTFVQSISSNVVAGVQHAEDERALIGYLMLLCVWLFEEPEAVNDLLGEGSNIQGLVAAIKVASSTMPLVAGLCALLLGIVYEFSTKDSPIPRATLQGLLNSKLGRETYVDRITKLRENPFVRDFEVLPQSGNGSLPDVFFDGTFVNFLKDNYSRFLRAVDRDPEFEVSIMSNGVQKGVSRELVDSLRAEVEGQRKALEATNAELLKAQHSLQQEQLDHRRSKDSNAVELGRIKQINQSLQNNHEEETRNVENVWQKRLDNTTRGLQEQLRNVETEYERRLKDTSRTHTEAVKRAEANHRATLDAANRRLDSERHGHEQRQQEHERDKAKIVKQHQEEIADADNRLRTASTKYETQVDDLKMQLQLLQDELSKVNKQHGEDQQKAREEYKHTIVVLDTQVKQAQSRAKEAESWSTQLEQQLKSEQDSKKDVQTELDDLLVVFGDLEAKRAALKARLKALGEPVSEDEDEGDEDGADEEGDEEDGDEEDGDEEDGDEEDGDEEDEDELDKVAEPENSR